MSYAEFEVLLKILSSLNTIEMYTKRQYDAEASQKATLEAILRELQRMNTNKSVYETLPPVGSRRIIV